MQKTKVDYICGIAKNSKVLGFAEETIKQRAYEFEKTKEKQRLFNSFYYKAGSWKRSRKMIVKAEPPGFK